MPLPKLHPETLADLEARGVPAVRAILNKLPTTDYHGAPVRADIQPAYAMRETDHGTVSVTRAEVENWLAWKEEQRDAAQDRAAAATLRWTKVGVVIAIFGTLAAIVAACEGAFALK